MKLHEFIPVPKAINSLSIELNGTQGNSYTVRTQTQLRSGGVG